VNEKDEVMGFNPRLLIAATNLTVQRVLELVRSLGGIAIASHVDREAFSVLSQLGFIPEDLRFDALEFSPRMRRRDAEATFPELKLFPWVSFSDAHYVKDIGRRTTAFTMREPSLDEMRQAFSCVDGRSLSWD
jgi:PHP family Zn ribbon phosphoesterase